MIGVNMLQNLYNLHSGETCIIAAPGPNLPLTPPEQFSCRSIGINTIYRYPKWKPDYYVWVDRGVAEVVPIWQEVIASYSSVAKFIPTPDFDEAKGENIYRFKHRPGIDLYIGGQLANQKKALTEFGITYRRIWGAALQIAWWLGFKTILLIGIQHKLGARKEHFWGLADYDPASDFYWEELDLLDCSHMMRDVRILNISEDTYLSEKVVPRGDWRDWRKDESKNA